MRYKLIYFIEHWKEGIHLLFRTKRFGVNGRWFSDFNSLLGLPTYKIILSIIRIRPIIENYKLMKYRAVGCHFLSEQTVKKLGWFK